MAVRLSSRRPCSGSAPLSNWWHSFPFVTLIPRNSYPSYDLVFPIANSGFCYLCTLYKFSLFRCLCYSQNVEFHSGLKRGRLGFALDNMAKLRDRDWWHLTFCLAWLTFAILPLVPHLPGVSLMLVSLLLSPLPSSLQHIVPVSQSEYSQTAIAPTRRNGNEEIPTRNPVHGRPLLLGIPPLLSRSVSYIRLV
jgi:hypothetical protein